MRPYTSGHRSFDDLIKGTVRVAFGLVTGVLNTVLFLLCHLADARRRARVLL
jgi:hypothetical protein